MPTTLTVPDGYGTVVAIATGAMPLLAFLQGLSVTISRNKARIPYPHAYATPQQCKGNPLAVRFNSAQRAHTNYMENMPQAMVSLLLAGLAYPRAAAGLGLTWLLFRGVYWAGYLFSELPGGNGRLYGAAFWLAQGGLWALTLAMARDMA